MPYLSEAWSLTSFSLFNKVLSSPLKSKAASFFDNASDIFKILYSAFCTLSCKSLLIRSDSMGVFIQPVFKAWKDP